MTALRDCPCGNPIGLLPPEDPPGPARCPACGRLFGAESVTTEPRPRSADAYTADAPDPGADLRLDGSRDIPDLRLRPGGLCSPGGVGLATFLCGPLAGFWLLSWNDGVLGRRGRGWWTLLAGLAWSMFLIFVLGNFTSAAETSLALVLPCGGAIGNLVFVVILAKVLHAKAYADQQQRKGDPAPSGSMVGRSIAGMVLYLGLAFGVAFLEEINASKVTQGNKTVYYTRKVSQVEAQRLQRGLTQAQVFTGPAEQEARLDRDGATLVVTLVLESPPGQDQTLRYEVKQLAVRLSRQEFQGQIVRIRVVDTLDRTRWTVDSDGP
jgi:hypothetical protein